MKISCKELRLWDYFATFIAPKCALSIDPNPYRDVVLRLAAHAPRGPLFEVIMAVAATQMHNLGHGEMGVSTWKLRGLALRSLRHQLTGSHQTPQEIIVTTVMMGFLEVSPQTTCTQHT